MANPSTSWTPKSKPSTTWAAPTLATTDKCDWEGTPGAEKQFQIEAQRLTCIANFTTAHGVAISEMAGPPTWTRSP